MFVKAPSVGTFVFRGLAMCFTTWILSLVVACDGGGTSGTGGSPLGSGVPPTPVGQGPAVQLALTVQPANAVAGNVFGTQPRVELRNASGQLVASDSSTVVNVAITSGTGAAGAVLSGVANVTANSGAVQFAGLGLDLAAAGYSLTFSATGLSSAVSAVFTVAAASGGGTFNPAAPGLIPADRRITWSAGIPGGIPSRTTIFANVKNAPYNAQGNGVADDTSAIQSAINACPANQVVYMPAGTYKITSTIHIKSNVTLRGAGPTATSLKWLGSASMILEIRDNAYEDGVFYNTSPYNLTGGYTKGSTSITTASNNWNVGDVLLIDQKSDGNLVVAGGTSGPATWCGRENGDRCMGQLVKILTRSATSITFEPPLYANYTASLMPQGILVKGITSNAGFEDFAVTNDADARDSMWWFGGYRCWMKNIDMKGSRRRHLWMLHDLQCEIRGCTFHDGTGNYGPDRTYGIFLGNMITASMVEDNIFYNMHVPIAFEGGAAGNVVSYNYITKVKYSDPEWAQPAIVEHGPHPMMNLIEGNCCGSKIIGDMYWGSASHNTYFRNRVYQATPTGLNYGTWLVDFYIWHKYENIVGNVLGTPGYETEYEENCTPYAYYGGKIVYKLGYANNSGSTAGSDPMIAATMIRHGNYDTVTSGVTWDPSIAVQQMPPSLTYAQKPAWMGANAWPAYGPDVAGSLTSKIPAQLRYEAMGSP